MAKYKHKCEQCGKEFEDCFVTTRFCNRDCYNTYRQEHRIRKRVICPVCKTEFQQKSTGQIFCSKKCLAKTKEKQVECICDYCGKEFTRSESHVKRANRKYCSEECRNNAMFWSKEDTQILVDNYGKMSYDDMIPLFSSPKTRNNIKHRAQYIGITLNDAWSDEEENILINNYSFVPPKEIRAMLPNRTAAAIVQRAKIFGLQSYFTLTHMYTNEEEQYLRDNYVEHSNAELALALHRSEKGIALHLWEMGLSRPTEINNYQNLVYYVRCHLFHWSDAIRRSYGYRCALTNTTGRLAIHHIRSFNLLFNETVEILEFPIYEDISEYNQMQLDEFLDTFMKVQDSYGQYICIREDIHKTFHKLYGYGNNTKEQWDDFINKYYT